MNTQLRSYLVLTFISFLINAQTLCAPPAPDDRRQKAKEAENDGDKKSKEQLTPPMLGHLKNADDAFKKAKDLEKVDPGGAQQERQKGLMEQQMAQQLKQQMDANQKSADDNKKSADLMRDPEEKTSPEKKPDETKAKSEASGGSKVIYVDNQVKAGAAPKPETDPAKKEIASLDDYVAPKKEGNSEMKKIEDPKPEVTAVEVAKPPQATWRADLNSVTKEESAKSAIAKSEEGAPSGTSGAESSPARTSDGNLGADSSAPIVGLAPVRIGKGAEDNGLSKDFFTPKKKKVVSKQTGKARAFASRPKKPTAIPLMPQDESGMPAPETVAARPKLKAKE